MKSQIENVGEERMGRGLQREGGELKPQTERGWGLKSQIENAVEEMLGEYGGGGRED